MADLFFAISYYRRRRGMSQEQLAEELGIPVQESVRTGGSTNGAPIHLSNQGVPVIVIGIPVRYIHTHYGIAAHSDVENAARLAAAILDKGYQVFFQPVGTAFYSDMELLRLVERVNRLRPFAFYMVDTLGSMYPGQVTRQFHLIHENMDPAIRLGFHGHNNLQLAFSNAQVLLGIQPSGS